MLDATLPSLGGLLPIIDVLGFLTEPAWYTGAFLGVLIAGLILDFVRSRES